MTAQADFMIERDPKMSRYFAWALGLHIAVIGALALSSWIDSHRDKFGDPNPGGASIGVTAVKSIPIPHNGPQNPLAHNTESETPQAPSKPVEREKKEVEKPDAIALKSPDRKKQKSEAASSPNRFRPFKEVEKDQLYSKQAPAVSSPMFSQVQGGGQIGVGPNTALGNRFGAYAQQIQDLIGQKWRTNDVDARVRSGPKVIATFEVMRDGSIRNIQLLQTSGIPTLDFSVRRAIEDANPLPPLPLGFDRDRAKIEFWFELKR